VIAVSGVGVGVGPFRRKSSSLSSWIIRRWDASFSNN
jgi:hypothetical protein